MRNIIIFALLVASCKSVPPRTEFCMVGDHNLLCIDKRMPQGQQEYERSFKSGVGYICSGPDDYALIQEWIIRRCSK